MNRGSSKGCMASRRHPDTADVLLLGCRIATITARFRQLQFVGAPAVSISDGFCRAFSILLV